MQEAVWRFVGFVSTIVGLICYALSSSFNSLFGEWNFLKIFLYSTFSLCICLANLFANKVCRHSSSLRFKAHSSFVVLAITSMYSYFSDKLVNGKPDAYSLVSCATFAVMSLSLSRQSECGFEVDLFYFFMGCLIVLLMKIKVALAIVGIGFSYALVILRSYRNVGVGVQDDDELALTDTAAVVLNVDQLARSSIDATTHDLSESTSVGENHQHVDNGSMRQSLARSRGQSANRNGQGEEPVELSHPHEPPQAQVRFLGPLVPGYRKALPCILEEACDYRSALEMQIRAMSALVDLLAPLSSTSH